MVGSVRCGWYGVFGLACVAWCVCGVWLDFFEMDVYVWFGMVWFVWLIWFCLLGLFCLVWCVFYGLVFLFCMYGVCCFGHFGWLFFLAWYVG